MQCTKCQTPLATGTKFCAKCGTRVSAPPAEPDGKRCPQCGTDNPANAKFCKKDGYQFVPAVQAGADKPPQVTAPSAPPIQPIAPAAQIAPAAPATEPEVRNAPSPTPSVVPHAKPTEVSGGRPLPEKAPVPAAQTRFCPKCGTSNAPTAKFCKKDGYPLQGAATPPKDAEVSSGPTPQAQKPQVAASAAAKPPAAPVAARSAPVMPAAMPRSAPSSAGNARASAAIKSCKGLMIGALVGVLVLASAGGGGYAYWAGYVGNRQGSVQNDLNAQLGNRGLGNVKVAISQDWVATLTGEVQNQSFKDQAFGLVSTHTALKSIVNNIQIAMLPADLQAKLSVALAEGGFSSAPTAQVDDTLMVTLSGFAADDAEKQRMLAMVQGVPGVKGVQDAIEVAYAEPAYESVELGTYGADSGASPDGAVYPQQPSPQGGVDRAALERTLISRLRAQGLNSVTGRFNPNMAVVLSGVVRSEDERYRALTIASGMPGINGVSDTIQIASAQAERPETNQGASIDPAKLEGEINRALRNRDVNGVSAQVGDDLSVVLKGSASAAEKDRAMQLVRQIRGIRGVKDNIFVVE